MNELSAERFDLLCRSWRPLPGPSLGSKTNVRSHSQPSPPCSPLNANTHCPAVVLLNVLDYYTPLRAWITSGVSGGLIAPQNEALVVVVDGPSSSDAAAHEAFDWGTAALEALDGWKRPEKAVYFYDWTLKMPTKEGEEEGTQTPLQAS